MSKIKATKYHIGKKGTIEVCEATVRACQYGSSEHLTPDAVARITTGNPFGEKETAIWFNQQTIKEEVGAVESLEDRNVAFPELREEPKVAKFIPTDVNKEYNLNTIERILGQEGTENIPNQLVNNLYFTAMDSDDLYYSFDEKVEGLTVQIHRETDLSKEEAATAAHAIAEHFEVPNRFFDVSTYVRDGENYNTIIKKTVDNSLTDEQAEDINQILKNVKAPIYDLGNDNAHRPIYDYLTKKVRLEYAKAYQLTNRILQRTRLNTNVINQIDAEKERVARWERRNKQYFS